MRASAHDIDEFVAGLDYPMFAVTVAVQREAGDVARSGCLVGFVTQCSIAPARFLVCLSKNNHTYTVARNASTLAVHVLGADQRELAVRLGEITGDEVDKLARLRWQPGPGGVPLLVDCPRWFVAEIVTRVDCGDHVGFILAPTEVAVLADVPPLYYSGVRDLDPGHPA